ncbi:rhomboid family intramembrane serine protease [Arenimonas daejeonensis]|uniref:rhomboid family intramembrane serine protease n=1 Tax=Arenimonas daejeonensis TaxID=370777 RepID=UPI0013153DC2|nr:rhomboid family intramembrane serine protease [Arenimonas daejeonensis]
MPAASRRIPWCTLLLCAATAMLSVHAAIEISGTWLGRVRIVQLEDYGLRFGYLRDLELWRLVTAQLVHVKQPHMVSDVFCLLLVGTAVERQVGSLRLFLLWLIGGSIAMLFSSLFVPWPWNLGTGASQAIMAIAGAGLWLAWTGVDRSKFLRWSVGFAIALAFAIDVVHVYYPKPGHVAGVLLGLLMASRFRA